LKVEIEPGARGQFDVFHEGEVIASKDKVGVIAKLFGGGSGFPEEDAVIETLAKRLAKSGQ